MNGRISSTDNYLGDRIRLLRRQKDWTQDQTSEKLGISIPAFSKIETGLTTVNMTRLKQLAQLFNITVYDLMHSAEEVKAKEASQELEMLRTSYEKKTIELIDLQIKAIKLYDELHSRRSAKRKK